MEPVRRIADLQKVTLPKNHVVALFDGNIESSHLLNLITQQRCRTTALVVDFGHVNRERISEIACYFPVRLEIVDGRRLLVEEAITPAIKANAMRRGHPVSSTLVRPILAKIAYDYANKHNCDAIIHASCDAIKSSSQINSSLRLLGYKGQYGSPYESEEKTLKQMQKELFEKGINFDQTHSCSSQSSLWCCQTEVVLHRSSESDVVYEGVYGWSDKYDKHYPNSLELTFEKGLPTRLNRRKMHLLEIIDELNKHAGYFGIGRFIGSEHVYLGGKTLDLREAPAATAIMEAHKFLEANAHDMQALAKKMLVDRVWLDEVDDGRWYGILRESLENSIDAASQNVNGTVTVSLKVGAIASCSLSNRELVAGALDQ